MTVLLFLFGFVVIAYAAPQEEIRYDIGKGKLVIICPTNGPDAFVAWYKFDQAKNKDVELVFGSKVDFPGLDSVALLKPTLEDSGVYTCRDVLTEEKIKIFKIKMFNRKDIVTKPPLLDGPAWVLLPAPLRTYDASRFIVAPCRASGKNVIVKAYRLKDTGEIDKQLKQKGVVIHRPKATDSGKYMCTAENAGGKLSHLFEIVIRVNGGESEWEEWGPCDSECGYGIQSRKRTCTNPRPANGGRSCLESMTERRSCRERACSQPRLTKFGFEITDTSLILDCRAVGIPAPKVQWKLDGGLFDSTYDSKNPKMVIPKTRARSGSYSCTVRNDAGYFTMYITIDV